MGPQNYNPNYASPIQKVMAVQAQKRQEERQQEQIGLRARQLDLSEKNAQQQQTNADRAFGFRQQQADQQQANFDAEFGYRAEKDAMALEAEALKAAEQERKKQEWAEFAGKPNKTADDFSEMIIKYPEMAKSFKEAHDLKSKPQQKEALQQATQVYSALTAGAPEVAINMLERRKEAAKNSDDQAAYDGADGMIKIIKTSPQNALASAGMYLAATVDGNDFAYTLGALDKVLPGNTAQDTKRLAEAARANGIPQKDINRILRETRGQDFETRMKKLNSAKKTDKKTTGDKAARKTTSTEMNSMFSYGKSLGLSKQQVAQSARQTRGMPIEERFDAIDAMSKASGSAQKNDAPTGDEGDFDAKYGDKKPVKKPSGPTPEFLKANEGKVFNTPNGKVKIVNGKPQKVD